MDRRPWTEHGRHGRHDGHTAMMDRRPDRRHDGQTPWTDGHDGQSMDRRPWTEHGQTAMMDRRHGLTAFMRYSDGTNTNV
ncbi:hypothetical protein NDU88_005736 [Pleurodeles waltl]|uniref:Uncharacterized protein n=1 Tax=Pleurodeles waltl TaxID=8319 RepID=A0AAV7L1Q7_PLEWA|nr:hypothetical protein NDU88_005736 [Pleurodeles waltl]